MTGKRLRQQYKNYVQACHELRARDEFTLTLYHGELEPTHKEWEDIDRRGLPAAALNQHGLSGQRIQFTIPWKDLHNTVFTGFPTTFYRGLKKWYLFISQH